jgi:hypothetical protein
MGALTKLRDSFLLASWVLTYALMLRVFNLLKGTEKS